jgi:beta-glucosidase
VTNDEWIQYNDALWETLLDQLTWEETTSLLTSGWRLTGSIESIAKPQTIDFNGSVGPVTTYNNTSGVNRGLAVETDDPDKSDMIPFYLCNGICAATFNKELMEEYGEQWGEESLWSGVNALYGVGVNLHRSPYGGRNFEYYSEDPVLMGKIAAQTVKGASSRGMYCYLKHCVLNEQESYRIGGYCWLTEQTMREIYLKPFEIAIEEGGASCVMTAEPAIGVQWSGQQGFVQTVLRNEFGMTGIAVSDYTRDVDGNYLKALLAGSDLPDGTINDLFDNISSTQGYGDLAQAMRESAHRILYTVVHSNAMNGITSNTRVIKLTPWWVNVVEQATKISTIAIEIDLIVLSAVVVVSATASLVEEHKYKKQNQM